tara:strand:+ start:376 stop:546 length:171 start_codon:yes stop_codon:yes gene_type:complete
MDKLEINIEEIRLDIERGQAHMKEAEGLIELLRNQLQEARTKLVAMKLESQSRLND